MTGYLFQSHSYPTQWAMHQAIAKAWLTADGLNSEETVREVLGTTSDKQLAGQAEKAWELNDLWGYDHAELIEAIEEVRR